MKQIQWFDQHYYQVLTPSGLEYLPSVTTILNVLPKPYLSKWRGDLGNDEADEIMISARNRGANIHNAVSTIARGGIIINADPCNSQKLSDQEIMNLDKYRNVYKLYNQFEYLQTYRFIQFIEETQAEILLSEDTVFSTEYGFAGTLDLILSINEGDYKINGSKPVHLEGGLYLADLKTGKSMPEEVWMQLAAYREAHFENSGDSVIGALCIHTNSLTKSNIEGLSVKVRTNEELDQDFENFLKVLEVWKFNPTVSAPKIFSMPAYLQIEKKKKEKTTKSKTKEMEEVLL